MLKINIFRLVFACLFLHACRDKPQKKIVWDSYPDDNVTTKEEGDTLSECVVSVDSQGIEYPGEPERLQNNAVIASHFELPSYTEQDFIVRHTAYTLSFNYNTNLANWVAWSLCAENSNGSNRRTDDFRADEMIPQKHRVDEYAYKGSNYDRGHMCPAADNKWDAKAMSESFLMSNICPQDPELNQIWWEHLEKAERRWAKQEGEVYICCGPVFNGVTSLRLGCNVKVPDAFFKVILSLKKGKEKAIGFYYVNDARKQTMESAVRTVDELEQITGYDFFSNVADDIEDKVEQSANLRRWK